MKVAEGQSKADGKKVRKDLGPLKGLTVQPRTKQRYHEGLQDFFAYLKRSNITLPKQRDSMDDLCSDYLEFLWSEGEGRACASNFLAALQDFDPKLRGRLPASWRLMKAWTLHEVPNRAPPMTEGVLRAMVGWSFLHEHFAFGISLLVGFYGLLRTGELLGVQNHQISMSSSSQPAVISLGLTKSGKRQGAAESITISERVVLQWLWWWKHSSSQFAFLTAKPHIWRATFNECLTALKLDPWSFRPYSLRRGGATFFFVKTGSLDRVLLLGRWTALKTAKIYLNAGLAKLADIQIPDTLLKPFHRIFFNTHFPRPQLEQAPLKRSRAGGRGKKVKTRRKVQKVSVCGGAPL